jgi:hypothetical protein
MLFLEAAAAKSRFCGCLSISKIFFNANGAYTSISRFPLGPQQGYRLRRIAWQRAFGGLEKFFCGQQNAAQKGNHQNNGDYIFHLVPPKLELFNNFSY